MGLQRYTMLEPSVRGEQTNRQLQAHISTIRIQHQIDFLLRAGNLSGAQLYQCTVCAARRNNHEDAVKRRFSKLARDNLLPYLHATLH